MVEEVRPQHLWDGQHPLGVPDGLEGLVGEQRGRRSRALRSARRAQITGLAREGQQILLGTVGAAHPGEPVLEQAAVQVAPNLLVDEPTPVPIHTVGMTGTQRSMSTGETLEQLILGTGVAKEHLRLIEPTPRNHDDNVRVIREELSYVGPSVIIARRACLEAIKRRAS